MLSALVAVILCTGLSTVSVGNSRCVAFSDRGDEIAASERVQPSVMVPRLSSGSTPRRRYRTRLSPSAVLPMQRCGGGDFEGNSRLRPKRPCAADCGVRSRAIRLLMLSLMLRFLFQCECGPVGVSSSECDRCSG
jgi:hypothetical protein